MIATAAMPKDGDRIAAQLTPQAIATARTVDATVDSSTQIDFNAASTFLRVYATIQDVYLKWGTTAVTSSNFDEVVPAGQIVDFFIPTVAATGVLYPSCTVIARTAGAAVVVIEK